MKSLTQNHTESHSKTSSNDCPSKPGYYSITPAEVRYCKALEPNAKLLYGEITALCNKEGYCWASNSYFAELYEVDTRTVRRWLESLKENNFIVVQSQENTFNSKRKIYLKHAFQIFVTEGQKCPGGEGKNVLHNSTSNNTSLPPLSSPQNSVPNTSLRSEEEEIHGALENTTLSPKEKKRLSRDYSEEEIAKALEIAKFQTVKKSLMGLLLNILRNPQQWDEPDKDKPKDLKPSQHEAYKAAKDYNQMLADTNDPIRNVRILGSKGMISITVDLRKVAEDNCEKISNNNCMYILTNGVLFSVSLTSSDFYNDIKDAITQLR